MTYLRCVNTLMSLILPMLIQGTVPSGISISPEECGRIVKIMFSDDVIVDNNF